MIVDHAGRTFSLLRAIIDGLPIYAIGESWEDAYAGNVTFVCRSGETIVIFNDCDSYDYVDSVRWNDGVVSTFDDIYRDGCEGEPSGAEIEPRLKAASVVVASPGGENDMTGGTNPDAAAKS